MKYTLYSVLPESNRVGGVITDPASHTTRHAGPHRAVHTFANDR